MTEEGTVSGLLDVSVDTDGAGMVRYRGTADWLTICNLDDEPPRTWESAYELAAAVLEAVGERDTFGNTLPFEA